MAKNRNKKKHSGEAPMDTAETIVTDLPQAMYTTETVAVGAGVSSGFLVRKIKKGVQMKRSKNVRKMKSIAKAISKSDKYSEKVLKHDNKKTRVQSAKSLYD